MMPVRQRDDRFPTKTVRRATRLGRVAGAFGAYALAALAGLAGLAAPAQAASVGAALVIGTDVYAGQSRHTACDTVAQYVGNRLRAHGFAVQVLLDAPSVALRSALDGMAAQLGGALPGQTLIYVCATGLMDGPRLFVLPADADLQAAVQPETQGVVMQALLNVLAGTGGAVIADLGLAEPDAAPHGASGIEAAQALLRARLPHGVHLALESDTTSAVGTLGRALAGDAVPLDAGWGAMAVSLRPAAAGASLTAQTIFLGDVQPLQPAPLPPPPAPPSAVPPSPVAPQPATDAPALLPAALAHPLLPGPHTAPVSSVLVASLPPYPLAAGAVPTGAAARNGPAPAQTAPAAQPAKLPPITVAAKPAAALPPGHRHGDTHDARAAQRIAHIQSALVAHGEYAGPVDGTMTARTIAAIRALQTHLGYSATGTLTPAEIVLLLNQTGARP